MSENRKINWRLLGLTASLIIAAFFVYANSLNGEFVYDDARQIVRNPLIQDSSLFGRALVSDVWAFKSDGTIAASNYWRPTFTAFNIIAFQAFGVNPFGWHLFNVLLHVGVCLLAFALLRRLKLSDLSAFAISLIFAVHPVHVESVAWIAGSPDLLFGVFFLGSVWFSLNFAENGNFIDLAVSLALFALALGSKEIAILCLPLFWLVFSKSNELTGNSPTGRNAFRKTIPFVVMAGFFFSLRGEVFFPDFHPLEELIPLFDPILSIPSAFVFYLKQMVFPLTLAVNYPSRPVTNVTLSGFVLPFLFSCGAVALFFLIAIRSFVRQIGLAFFLLTLIPALNLTVFVPEQFVHDRYLYFPLLGFLIVVISFIEQKAETVLRKKAGILVFSIAVIVSIPLAVKTIFQNRIWSDELTLWSHALLIDPNSSYNYLQLGAELSEKNRHAEALNAFNSSLDIKPSALAFLGRAQANLRLERIEEAVWDLQTVVEMPNKDINAYTLYQTYEALAIAYLKQNKLPAAEKTLIEARKRLPIYFAALTEKLAVVYYQLGNKDKALDELEGARAQAKAELLPGSKTVLLRLGMLYRERGETEKSRAALMEYLKSTANLQDKLTLEDRKQALELLKK